MFSLQTMFGKGDKFYGLLEQSAEAARESARAMHELVTRSDRAPVMAAFSTARAREKALHRQIGEELVNTFVTALDREDIEALNSALYKIPKSIEKFAERYVIVADRLHGIDFDQRAALLEQSVSVVVEMIGELRKGLKIDRVKKLRDSLHALESEADRVMRSAISALFRNENDVRQLIKLKAVYESLESATDKCQDVANVIESVVLENS